MINQPTFYFQTVRKITGAFGALFNGMNISRYSLNGNQGTILKTVPVPIRYAGTDKALAHDREHTEAQDTTRFKRIYPRMSFQLTGMQYDEGRKLNTLGNYSGVSTVDGLTFLKMLQPVPFDLSFDLDISVKNVDDGLQIIEQILPNFTPSFNLPINDIPELGLVRDVPVILVNSQFSDNFEGTFEDNRIINYKLSFVVKAYLYPPITNPDIIKKVIATLYPTSSMEVPNTAVITVEVNPLSANETDVDSNGDPTYTIDTTIVEN